MPFGMSWDDFRRTSAAAKAGDMNAEARIRAGAGFHISGAAKVALGVAGAVVAGPLLATAAAAIPGGGRLLAAVNPQVNPNLAATFPGTRGGVGPSMAASALLPPPATRPSPVSILSKVGSGLTSILGGAVGGAAQNFAAGPCPPGSVRVPPFIGPCVNTPGGPVTGGGVTLSYGEAVTARYGTALVPASRTLTVRRCPRGAVLANDGYCYNRGSLNKRDRMWIPARKPLLTGGDLNAITKANRAANKIKAQQKRLQAMGMLAKPKTTRRAPHVQHHHAPGITVVDT